MTLAALLTACTTTTVHPMQPSGFAVAASYQEPAIAEVRGEEEMMAKWMEVSTPGAEHKLLSALEGEWEAVVKSWWQEGAEPSESRGVMVNKMIHGGRFLLSEFSGQTDMGPMTGTGIFGYDNAQRTFVSTWLDSMSTTIMPVGMGQYEEGKNRIVMNRDMLDALSGKMMHLRDVTTRLDQDHHTFEMFEKLPDGRERKSIEIHYTRKK